jgi:hypothetical protein
VPSTFALSSGSSRYPLRTTAGMGFAPSSGWAQALIDVCTDMANLPTDRQVHMDKPCPELPVCGGIVDDVWGVCEIADPRLMMRMCRHGCKESIVLGIV